MRGIYFSLILISLSLVSFSQTRIKGTAKDYTGFRVELTTKADYISEKQILLDEDSIAPDGSFELSADLREVSLVEIKIGRFYSLLYVKTGTTYEIEIPKYEGRTSNVLNDRYPVNAVIIDPKDEKLNKAIVNFNGHYDSFIKDHFILILRRGAKNKVDSFKQVNPQGPMHTGFPYFDQYVSYQFALLDLISSHSKKELYENYLKSQRILYHHDAYMKFFNEFYKDYFKAFYFVEYEVRLNLAIENHQSIDSLDHILSKNRFLKRKDIRELVMIKELYFNTVNGKFEEKDTRKMLEELKTKTKIEEHKLIISRLLEKSDKLALGSKAPEFKLPNMEGEFVSLTDFEGKYVYIDFWATWCAPCMKSMRMMDMMYPKYRDSIEFVSISVDKNMDKAKRFVDKEEYEWTFLHFNGNEQLKEDYEVLAIPTYYLIDPNGKLIQTPALHPESGIERYFRKISEVKKDKKDARFWEEKPVDK